MTDVGWEPRAWFLGPHAENADLAERLLLAAFRDHVNWRRSHHPDDPPTITAVDRRSPSYQAAADRLAVELQGLMEALHGDVPFFSGRYQGHMLAEQTIASQLAWFATMLCNPNNVVSEVSPVTTRLELEVAAQLATMIGYRPEGAWGHLTSGGTIANFEAMWIARGVRYLPVGLALAARQLSLHLPVRLPGGAEGDLRELTLWELLNLTPVDALDAYDEFHRRVPADVARRALDEHSLSAVGYQDYTRRLSSVWSDPLPAGIVLVPGTAHYSWEKIVRALGIGSNRLVPVGVDGHARMAPELLAKALAQAAASQTPVLAVVAVCGSTEEGSVDRLDALLEVRDAAARSHGTSMHLHVDACYGGYAASLLRSREGALLTGAEVRAHTGSSWPDDAWLRAIAAIGQADSVTIDPHKLGFVPYPAGAFLLRDRRGRNLVSLDPPYLAPAPGPSPETEGFLGRWILEGSKPGASAAAAWLSHRVVPLHLEGHGQLIHRTMAGARRLYTMLGVDGVVGERFSVVRLPEPDLNVVAWVIGHAQLHRMDQVNALNEGIHQRLGGGRGTPPYWITRTRLLAPGSRGVALPLVQGLGLDVGEWEAQGIVMLRVTVMDPFFVEQPPSAPDHCLGLVEAVRDAAQAALLEVPA